MEEMERMAEEEGKVVFDVRERLTSSQGRCTILELREYYYDTACAFRKTHVVDGNRLKYEGFEALSLSVDS